MAATFVGRSREFEILRASLTDTMSGAGRVVLLAGEPGIGKTATALRFAEHANAAAATVLVGASYEGEAQAPFAPWAQALGAYARGVEPDGLRRKLGAAAPALVQLIEDARRVLPESPPPTPLSPDQERLRLYDGIARMLLGIAVDSPVLLVLDDLHWADPDSLGLLRYVARVVGSSRVLVVGTYRNTEVDVDPHHPLADVLGALAREARFEGMSLSGLDKSEVADFLAAAVAEPPPPQLVRAIHEETSGNPFYVRELYRHLAEEGLIADAGSGGIADLGIPETVRHVLVRRLSRLSEESARVLRIACAFSGGFTFPVLQRLSGLSEARLLDAIDEALRGGFIRPPRSASSHYDFSHALVRHALLEELNPDRAMRLRRRIAEALEEIYADCLTAHAGEIAAHYHASRALPGGERGVEHALRAADRAGAVAAHEQAVGFLRMARDLTSDGPPARRAEVLCRLAIAEADALLLAEAADSAELALIGHAEADGDQHVQADFLARIAKKLKDGGADRHTWERLVERGLALTAGHRDLTWARLTLLRDPVEVVLAGDVNLARWLGHDPDAVATARAEGNEEDYAMTLEPYEWRSREDTAATLALARSWQTPAAMIQGYNAVVRDLLHRHDAARSAFDPLEEMLSVSRRHGSIPGHVEALVQLSFARGLLGDLEGQTAALEQARELVDRLGRTHRLRGVVESGGADIHGFLAGESDWERQAAMAKAFVARAETARTPLGFVFTSLAILDHAFAGNHGEAIRLVDALTPVLERMPPVHYHQATTADFIAWALWELNKARPAAAYLRLVRDMVGAGVSGPLVGSHALTLARMHALLGDDEESAQCFAQARVDLARTGKLPMRAMADHDEAVALMRRGASDRQRVGGLLDAAVAAFGSLAMTGWRDRALRLRRKLGGVDLPGGLTRREAEVLQLLASGRTNRELAQELFLSTATVERHLANIYRKIGARTRVQAAAFALDHGLRAPDART